MFKKINLALIVLVLATLILIIYLTTTVKSVTLVSKNIEVEDKISAPINKENIINPEKLEAEYKIQTKLIMDNYIFLATDLEISDSTSLDHVFGSIIELREKLTKLNVPEKYKDLHLSLVLAFSNFEIYLKDGDEEKNKISADSIEKAKNSYSWLNN